MSEQNLIIVTHVIVLLLPLGMPLCQLWLPQSPWEGVVLGVVVSVVIMFTKVLGFLIHSCSFLRMHFFVLLKIYLFVIQLFLAGLGLCCCVQAFSRCGEQRLLHCKQGLQSAGSVVVAEGLSCLKTCGIFPEQRLNQCSLHWLAHS